MSASTSAVVSYFAPRHRSTGARAALLALVMVAAWLLLESHAAHAQEEMPDDLSERAARRHQYMSEEMRARLVEAFDRKSWSEVRELLSVENDDEDRDQNSAGASEEETGIGSDDGAEVSSVQPLALPGGTGTAPAPSQQITLPKGEGSIQGMGESFSPNLSSGTGTFSVPIALPSGRAGVGASLALSYSTSGGNGAVGVGWSLGAPFIARQTDKGLPRYQDSPAWTAQEDRFIYNGGQELVPVDNGAARAIDEAPVPGELSGWQQYRARVEGAFMRFFRAPDASRWVVQSKDGTRFEFGCVAGAATCDASAVESDPEDATRIFSWQLVRMSDAHGASVQYRYLADGGHSYLSDIYYDMPARCGVALNPAATRSCSARLDDYGRHVRLVYDTREDATTSYIRTWKTELDLRLIRIEVTSHEGQVGQRYLVRRYHFSYDSMSFHSLLTSVEVEGRPTRYDSALGVYVGGSLVREESLGDAIVGTLLPPMRFGYTEPAPTSTTIAGFGGIDGTIHMAPSSPSHSLDDARTELMDVNGDGLSDVLVTDPARFGGQAGVFFNGFSGRNVSSAGSFSEAVRVSVPVGLSNVMTLSNKNVRMMDVDGDGHGDLLHMPRQREYGYFVVSKAPSNTAGLKPLEGWSFAHVPVKLPAGQQDPRVDLGSDAPFIKTIDVNRDSLIDVVATTGSSVQTWLNLGHYEGGDGRFGSVTWEASGASLHSDPVVSCLPTAGRPLDFSEAGTRLADMNGDGLLDIVQLSPQRVVYFVGRGEGAFGDGDRDCASGLRTGRETRMANPPVELNVALDNVHLVDLNGDGADDVLQIGFDRWSVWFNRAGTGLTERLVLRQTPFAPASLNRVRVADIDGSGTVDVVFGDAGRYRWVDPMGGVRPRLLQTVDNGLGALTTLAYGSSAEDYLRDLAESQSCDPSRYDCFTWHREVAEGAGAAGCDARIQARSSVCVHRPGTSPVVSTVVRRVSTTDRMNVLGVAAQVSETEYAYHDGYYEGIEQEFRGFGAADAIAVGDRFDPTSATRTFFHQGRRPNEIASDRLADNPHEALKGREYLTEASDAFGTYASSSHASYRVRRLLTGLDGRAISYAFVAATDELRYDNAPFTRANGTLQLTTVEREEATAGVLGPPRSLGTDGVRTIAIRGSRHAHLRSTIDVVDNLGHLRQQTSVGRVGAGEAIVSEQQSVRVDDASCGGSGWLFRTTRSYLRGASGGPNYKDTTLSYNACGDVVYTAAQAELPSEMPSGFTFARGSGAGPTYTQAGQTLNASSQVNAWGQTTASCGGGDLRQTTRERCLRYGEVSYDAAYSTFVESEATATKFIGVSMVSLATTATWDAGLGALTSATDPNLTVSKVYYDGLGRLTATVLPDAQGEVTCASNVPTTRIFYELTTSPETRPLSRIHTIQELDCRGIEQNMLQGFVYIDGLGRRRAALAQGDRDGRVWDDERPHVWVRGGAQLLSRKGKPWRAYQAAFYDGAPSDLAAVLALPNVPYAEVRYDAFGRTVRTIAEDRTSYTRTLYHALSTDAYDPVDVDDRCGVSDESCGTGSTNAQISAEDGHPSWFDHTYATVETDGHGRAISQHLRQAFHDGVLEHHYLFSYYRPDGAVTRILRALAPDNATRPAEGTTAGLTRSTARLFYYDTMGRRIGSSDSDTNYPGSSLATGVWRYLYNRVNDLVAVRDPRGSGQNFYYDRAGRLIGESYAHSAATEVPPQAYVTQTPVGSVALEIVNALSNVQARYFYDDVPAWAVSKIPGGNARSKGRATGTTDRGQRNAIAYDARGNVVWSGKQLALLEPAITLTKRAVNGVPVAQTGLLPDYVEGTRTQAAIAWDERLNHTYEITQRYDHAGRVTSNTLPKDPDFVGTAPVVGGKLAYHQSGAPNSASLVIDTAVYPVVYRTSYTRDGLAARTLYGDNVVTSRIRTDVTYDDRRRPVSTRTTRTPTSGAAPLTLGSIGTLVAQDFHWDAASNLTGIDDLRPRSEWPSGHLPQSVSVRHDALYRVAGVEYDYGVASDAATDWRDTADEHLDADPMHAKPASMVPQGDVGLARVVDIAYEHDWLANMTSFHDDAELFYERSIGEIINGQNESIATTAAEARPSALYLAHNVGEAASNGHRGWLETTYGVSGNLATMTVHGRCRNASPTLTCTPTGSNLSQRRSDLRVRCLCDAEQHYVYNYDELNRISEARRFDREAGSWELKVRQRYRYDASNQRTLKQTMDIARGDSRVALYVLPGDFERRGLVVGVDGYDAIPGETETQYLVAGARVVWQDASASLFGIDADHRITVAVSDLIQSTSAVIDLMSGEPLEVTGFYPNGAREHHFASSDPAAVDVPLEHVGFTGKEADEEVGLVYFGQRYLVARIGRWATPDPLSVHAAGGGEVGNSYHYLGGNLLQARDPLGLREFDSYEGYANEMADSAVPHEDMGGQGHWLTSDREDNTNVWSAANFTNLQNENGNLEYTKIEQRADFYRWFGGVSKEKGHETRWAGAAAQVADLAHAVGENRLLAPVGKFVLLSNDEMEMAAQHGNKMIFDDVFGKLRSLYNGAPVTGEAARKWDEKTLAEEQMLVQPMYKELSAVSVKKWELGAQQSPQLFMQPMVLPYYGVKLAPFPHTSDMRNPTHRWEYGMRGMGYTQSSWDATRALQAADMLHVNIEPQYLDGSAYREMKYW